MDVHSGPNFKPAPEVWGQVIVHAVPVCSRAFIRFACGDEQMPVPSPTYVLLNTYDEEILEGSPIHHIDLYRISEPESQIRLDMPSLLAAGTALLEWPERLCKRPETHVNMQIHTLRAVRP